MRIDVHSHIFTLRAILSREAIRVFGQRLRERELPGWLVDAVEELLDDQLDRPEYLDERRLLKLLLQKLTGIDSFNQWITDAFPQGDVTVRIHGDLDDLPAEVLGDLLTRIANKHPGDGVPGKILNVIETLRTAMQPTITDVADSILKGMDPDDVIVALMMDVYHGPESARDRRSYRRHILETAEAALQRPGRVLPFFGVHPDRPSHFDSLVQAVEQRGFVGVKLYPSLGYSVDSGPMRRVYDYCVRMELPVLLHCGHGGFYRDEQKKQLCDPAQWQNVLNDPDYKGKLKVCFAHFGGWEALGRRNALGENFPLRPGQPQSENWAVKIRDYLIAHPNVYTDLAKHVAMFAEPEDTKMYFDTMLELLDEQDIGERILYGTDAWLLRLDMSFDRYRDLWSQAAAVTDPKLLERISTEGTKAFLGLPTAAGTPMAKNIERFVDYMRANRLRVGAPPARWLRDAVAAVGEDFLVDRDSPMWSRKSLPARLTYAFLGDMLSVSDKKADWRAAGNVRLNRLEYYDEHAPDFGGNCRALARQLVQVMKKRPERFAPGNDEDSVFLNFTAMLRDGSLRLCDVAAALDTAYDFPEVSP